MLKLFLLSGAICSATLLSGSVGAAADSPYDRKLERAVLAIVAKKVGPIRGSLAGEWRPPAPMAAATASEPSVTPPPVAERPPRSISASIDLVGPEPDLKAPVKPGRIRARLLPTIIDGR